MIKIKVDLEDKSYPIFIGNGILDKFGEMYKIFGFGQQGVLITDTNVQKYYGQQIRDSLEGLLNSFECITLPAGETSKSLATIEKIITRMLGAGFDRNVVLFAFGGGVVGDITGFTASIYKRGVQFIQVPTTLLAQVDSSVGGKTGVNHPSGKNMIGTFYQPKMVWMDLALLNTLPKREIICGLGEIIKYGIIKDISLFTLIEENIDRILALELDLMQEIIKRCCEIKAEIVASDEQERDQRLVLNFGHTIGHALEAALGYKKISHGEAVLLGMITESKIALDSQILGVEDFKRIQNLIAKFDLDRSIKTVNPDALLHFLKTDKKIKQGNLRFILPTKIGDVFIADDVEPHAIKEGFNYLHLFNQFKSKP